jgi:peptidyl-tRNA hydrolase
LGKTANLSLTPDNGYIIDRVSGCGGSLSGNTYTTSSITADCTVSARFVRIFTVTATAGAGGGINPASTEVVSGSTTVLTVTPDSGYAIDRVSGCDGSLRGTTYTTGSLSADCTVNARFVRIFTVTATAGAGGGINPASTEVVSGSTTVLTITPDSGYAIDRVSGCDGSLRGTTYATGSVDADCTVNASFVRAFTVTATAGAGGSISPASTEVVSGSAIALTVMPGSGYTIDRISGCDGSLRGTTYTTGSVVADCTVNARFVRTFTVTAIAGTGGGISPASTEVISGSTTALTVTPDSGYAIGMVSGCDGSLSGMTYTTGSLSADCIVSASFVTLNAVTPAFSLIATKGFTFSWTDNPSATHYRLLENPDGNSGFTQVGSDIAQGSGTVTITVPLHKRINAQYVLQTCSSGGCVNSNTISVSGTLVDAIGYFKAANTGGGDYFGYAVSLSSDGNTLAVGAYIEASNTTGINSTPNNLAGYSGAVYVFNRVGNSWAQQAYIKPSNTQAGDQFGYAVALSGDGNTLAAGAIYEDSGTTGINSIPDEGAADAGAVYVFSRAGSVWSQQAYVKPSNTGAHDDFGHAVALSEGGDTLAVGAMYEDSSTTGIDSTPNDNSFDTGAVYVFNRAGSSWTQQAYVKASSSGLNDYFGGSVALSSDGNTLAVGAYSEDSSTTGIDSTPDDGAADAGAAYVFSRTAGTWSQQAYVKASNTEGGDNFGESIALSGDGDTLAVGAALEDSSTTGIDSVPDEGADGAGATYVFSRTAETWSQQAYIKASNTESGDNFGGSVALSSDGDTLAVGAALEDSSTSGLGSTPDEGATDAGAAYVFSRAAGTWSQQAYVKASNAGGSDFFGQTLSLSADGGTLAVGAHQEDSSTTGINSTPDEGSGNAGAAYLY